MCYGSGCVKGKQRSVLVSVREPLRCRSMGKPCPVGGNFIKPINTYEASIMNQAVEHSLSATSEEPQQVARSTGLRAA